jgi:hypothetical protein
VSFVIKTSTGHWLQDGSSTIKDFFLHTSDLLGDLQLSAPLSTAEGSTAQQEFRDSVTDQLTSVPAGVRDDAYAQQLQQKSLDQQLPDITKGVPWLPGQAPAVHQTCSEDAPQDTVDKAVLQHEQEDTQHAWFASASYLGDLDPAEIEVCFTASLCFKYKSLPCFCVNVAVNMHKAKAEGRGEGVLEDFNSVLTRCCIGGLQLSSDLLL